MLVSLPSSIRLLSNMQQLGHLSEETMMSVSTCHSTVTVWPDSWPFDSLRLTSRAVSGELPAVGCRQSHFHWQWWLAMAGKLQ